MRWHLVVVALLLLLVLTEAARPKKKKPSKGKKPAKKPAAVKGTCDFGGPKLTAANTKKYTDKGKCPCWWDITRNDCACCKKGVKATQCGYPMHKFCYKKDDAGKGCPGVCNNKYTLSQKGFPCYSDHTNTDCAWCNKLGWQCEQNKVTGPLATGKNPGSRCSTQKNQKYCTSVQGDCRHIASCDPNAECKKDSNVGKFGQFWKCVCKKGWTGNGIQCKDEDGNLSGTAGASVEVTLTMTAGEYTDTYVDGEFSHGSNLESLIGELESAGGACTGEECEATYEATEA